MGASKRGTGHARDGHRTVASRDRDRLSATFVWPVRVYFEDTDAGGVVYHANYLRFMERARTEWLRALGFEQDELRTRFGVQFVVIAAHIEYRRAARFNAQLVVSVTVTDTGRASLTFAQQIREADVLICEAEIRAACVDTENFKPRPLPQEIVAELIR
ncbi:MAG TPA: tol-pal system-associated acyl-CoA thioesterase [Gammaproteobacteria bacterium]|nr:tol-pal system-associated acyl-CoA thioesterase [Gammaproteobacteria bacterium]